jgi:hypothetical protein
MTPNSISGGKRSPAAGQALHGFEVLLGQGDGTI